MQQITFTGKYNPEMGHIYVATMNIFLLKNTVCKINIKAKAVVIIHGRTLIMIIKAIFYKTCKRSTHDNNL